VDRIVHYSCQLFGHPTFSRDTGKRLDSLLRIRQKPGTDIYGLSLKEVADTLEAEYGTNPNGLALPVVETSGTGMAHDIEPVPGGFLLWGKVRGQLTGKPWDVLRVLCDSSGRCLARAEIFRRVWEENTLTNVEQAVRDAVSAIRTAFRKACNKARVKLPKHNFVVGRGRGDHLVYELNPPPRESIDEK
jgi:hypothetical protein